jgi:HEPN domain-containing protein
MKEAIINQVKNWIAKAENDLKIGTHEMTFQDPATDAICFHAQQCVEKYLKAYLVFHQQFFRKTHDIKEITNLCKVIDQDFDFLFEIKANEMTIYATELRYADDFVMPSIEETQEAIVIAEKVKDFVLEKVKDEGFEM